MTFLSTIFLLALPLALAPVVLHLFDRRRNVTIEWGAMQFLVDASTQRTSARRLKHWLLLLLRMLAVAALVTALARPMLPGHWFGSSEQSETILIIDNSMSTQRTVEGGMLFSGVLERARLELNDLPTGSMVRILQSSPYPIWVTPNELQIHGNSSDDIDRQLAAVQPTSAGSDLLASLFTACQADLVEKTRKRNLVLVTDGQAADWKTDDTSGWKRLQETLQSATIPTQLQIVEVRPDTMTTRNVAINFLKSSRVLAGIDQSFTLTAQIQNYADVESSDVRLKWTIDGREIGVSDVPTLPSGNTHEATWRHAFDRPGVYALSCKLADDTEKSIDDLAADNDASVVIEVRDEVPVLVIESASEQPEILQDSFFVQTAMGWIEGEAMEQHGVFRPVIVGPEDVETIALAEFRAVIVPNFIQFSPAAVDRLKAFTMNGGGIWIAMGPRADIEMFNQYLFDAGDGLSSLAIDGIVSENDEKKSPVISTPQRNHPATRELADANRLDTTDIRVRRRFRFVQPGQSSDISALLGLSNGEPLALEKSVGQGRVIVMGIPLTMRDWSDLARSQAFVVMVQDWLNYLTQPQWTRHNLLPGDPIALHLPDGNHREAFLKTPSGASVELAAEPLLDGVMFRSTRTVLPGHYELQLGLSGDTIPFHIQRSLHESDLRDLSDDNRSLLKETAGLTQNLLSTGMAGHSHRDPVWPMLLMLLIALMSAELVLSGIIARERFGTDSIPETSESISRFAAPSLSAAATHPFGDSKIASLTGDHRV
jgi:hypothetical protein